MAGGFKLDQKHGKARVRVSRVWRRIASAGGGDVIVEWNVSVSLDSNCHPAYTAGNNSAIVATDTMKNTVSFHPFSSICVLSSGLDSMSVFRILISLIV